MLNNNAITEEIKRGSLFVENACIKDNYINVTIGNELKVYVPPFLDTTTSSPTKSIIIPEEGLILKPNELYLGRTNEFTKTYGFVPLLTEFDETATAGMDIHITAGFGDNGFEGTWTLEIVCALPTRIYPNMIIGRLYYNPLIGSPNIKYHGKYFGQIEPTASKLSDEYTNVRTRR